METIMQAVNRLQHLFKLKANRSKHAILVMAVYPPLISALCVLMLYMTSTSKDSSSIYAILSLFIMIAATFCLIPAAVILVFVLPTFLFTRDSDKLIKSGELTKTAVIAVIISTIILISTQYLL